MRVVIQRVHRASVSVEERTVGEIGRGLLVFHGVGAEDNDDDIAWLARKIPQIRCFEDEDGKLNRSVQEIGGGILLISQFTLYGNLRKGTRPSFNRAAEPDIARTLFARMREALEQSLGAPVPTGEFGGMMRIEASNDGPVTLVIDTRDKRW